jgi:hypothetical protein
MRLLASAWRCSSTCSTERSRDLGRQHLPLNWIVRLAGQTRALEILVKMASTENQSDSVLLTFKMVLLTFKMFSVCKDFFHRVYAATAVS